MDKKMLKTIVMCCEVVLAIVALILLMATTSVSYKIDSIIGSTTYTVSGIAGIFGGTDPKYAASWAGLLSFIFIIVAIVALCLVTVFALLKKKFALANICKFVAAGLLIVAGIFVFFEVAAFQAANGDSTFTWGSIANAKYSLGAGWLIGGILAIVAGGLSVAEAFLIKD